ncbi:uncharacterized protein LOC111321821 isoform X1 [Stylophora pistillata]|uniref:uncharacterized protein LOC111321821 isoform X1 n=1 Tax=Stylophora pistillata TaxID=50429 RepID=UPI000C057B6E|nr:uncharacterized protein LOC111321821 isoform X1 [Stylophora pistillata]
MHSMKYVCIGGKYGSQPACNGTRALPFLPNMSALEFTVANSVDKNKSSCNGRRGELSMAHTTRPASCSLLNYVLLIGTGAEVINDCDNTDSGMQAYPDIYYTLASDENSFKIESALYPLKKPSSVRVFVNLYGKNGSNSTDNSTPNVTKYTWSLNCLYAAFPAVFLEILSLGSIIVTPRTQELNLKFPHFCCKVPTRDRKRMTEDLLAAVSRILDELIIAPCIPPCFPIFQLKQLFLISFY